MAHAGYAFFNSRSHGRCREHPVSRRTFDKWGASAPLGLKRYRSRQHERGVRAYIGSNFGQRLSVQARVLADVERRKMKSKSAHLSQQRINHQFSQPLSAVCGQAFADQRKIALESRPRYAL